MEKEEKSVLSVDVSKNTLVAYWKGIGKAKTYSNDKKGIDKLVQQIKSLAPSLTVLESTGGYEHGLCELLLENSLSVAKVNPGRVRHFCCAKGYLAKTDPIDARAIYEFGMVMDLTPQTAPSPELKEVKQLFLRREQIVKIMVMEKNHLQAPCITGKSKSSIKKILRALRQEKESIDKQLASRLPLLPEAKDKLDILDQEKGVGPVLLAALLVLLPELGTLNRRSVAALVGLAPYNNDSGKAAGTRSIRGGRSNVRTVLYMSTLSVIQHNGTIKAFYKSLLKRGKKKMVAITACMRKYLIHLNSLVRTAIENKKITQEEQHEVTCAQTA